MLIGYARVSSQDQTLQLQHDALTDGGCEKLFREKLSGASTTAASVASHSGRNRRTIQTKRETGGSGGSGAHPPRRRPQRNRRPIPDRNPHSGAGRGVSERGSGFPNRARSAGSQKPSRGSEPDDFQPQPAATSPASRTSRLDAGPSRSATGGFSFALRNRLVFCRLKIVFGNPDTSGHPSNTTAVHPEWGSSLDRGFR